MNLVILHEDCMHPQDVLINCFEYEDAVPYVTKARKRGTCKICGIPLVLERVVIVRGEGEFDRLCLEDPDAIDVSGL